MLIDLLLVGFGNVGRRFVRLLQERSEILARAHDLEWRVTGIATRRHGMAFDRQGLDVEAALAVVETGRSLDALQPGSGPALRRGSGQALRRGSGRAAGDPRARPTDALSLIALGAGSHPCVLVETTVLDIHRGQPAIDHVRAAFAAGAHVITANKGPVAFAYDELASEARRAGRTFLFEGAVMDGVPIFNLVRETLPAVDIIGFRGVLNSTTNYMLTAMASGREASDALADMQAAGIAEADAALDVDGWDAAVKTAALVNVLMDGMTRPQQINRVGIGGVTREDVQGAMRRRERIRLIASAERHGGDVVARVAPMALPESDPLAQLRGMANGLMLRTDLLGEIGVLELDSGLTPTAYALLSDLVAVRRRL